MPEPWLQSSSRYQLEDVSPVSAQVFQNYLQQQYQNLPQHVKAMMSFAYFAQQSELKRPQIEASIARQMQPMENIRHFSVSRLKHWRILSLFEDWQDIHLWHALAAAGKGLVVEFDITQSGFDKASYNNQAQHLAAVKPVSAWLPEDDLYYLFHRPQGSRSVETEWRLIRKVEAADRQVVIKGAASAMFRLPTAAVKRIILGYQCSPEYCLQVKQYLSQDINYRHSECVQAQLDPKTLRLQRVAIS